MDDRATDGGERTATDGTSDSGTSGSGTSESGTSDSGTSDSGTDDSGTDRLWLVERTYTDKGLVSLVYATPDGEYAVQRQRSMNMLQRGADVTAAIPAEDASLEPVDDETTREQYADEAARMAADHDPNDAV